MELLIWGKEGERMGDNQESHIIDNYCRFYDSQTKCILTQKQRSSSEYLMKKTCASNLGNTQKMSDFQDVSLHCEGNCR